MVKPLGANELKPRSQFNTDYQLVLSGDQSIEDVMQPEFWAKINGQSPPKLNVFDRIIVIPESGDKFVEFLVSASGQGYAKLMVLVSADVEQSGEPIELRTTEIHWRGPALRYCIERTKDNNRLKTGFKTRRDAEIAARDYELVTA